MRLGILTSSVSPEAGGLLDVTRELARAIHDPPTSQVQVIGLEDDKTAAALPGWGTLPVKTFATIGPDAWGYAPGLSRFLLAADLDVLHVHGLWMYPSVASLRWARRHRGLIISPHGMLDPWALNNARWKKRIVARLCENAHLRRAGCLHALTIGELQAIRGLGLANPVSVVPNAIHLPSEGRRPAPGWRDDLPGDAKVLLYLGRLHPKKGLTPLLDGWCRSHRRGADPAGRWHLVIAGWDQSGHDAELRTCAQALGAERVHFVGPQFGADKDTTYAAADAFVLPSFSEGLPMVVLEAWSYRLPVLMTADCNLPQGFAAGAAFKLTTDPHDIARALDGLFAASDHDRRIMGERGHELVLRQFSWDIVADEMRAVYAWLAGGGQRPASVVG